MKNNETIVIIDNGSQTAHLIGRRLHQLGIQTQYTDPHEALKTIKETQAKGIILSGGPSSVYEEGAPTVAKELFELNIPMLGICYGWQLMSYLLGGKVELSDAEYGQETLQIAKPEAILASLPQKMHIIMSHGDTVTKLPPDFVILGSTKRVRFAAVRHTSKPLFGIQFHPEAFHTENGMTVLQNFVETICGLQLNPLPIEPKEIIQQIKEQVGDKKVICAVSGGVDSTVAAFLIGKAIGKNLIPVYVDSGLMRPGTTEIVKYIFSKLIKADLIVANERSRFLHALKGVTDPEIKRKTIGKLYIDIFKEIAKKHKNVAFLGQGTIYSDVIESKGSKGASLIKSHHNVGGLPKDLGLDLVEPLRSYYKDQVREIGRLAGLPEDIVMQQPFPGPGYAVRIRGEVTEERLEQVQKADKIVIDEMKKAGLYEQMFQCFAVMTGAYSTAVKGDARAFAEVVAIRAYTSSDVMTSQPADLPFEVLKSLISRIVNEVPKVSRVVLDVTPKPPATMEWE